MSIRCISKYRSNAGVYAPGQEIADMPLEKFLLKDSPGSFEILSGHDEPLPPPSDAVVADESESDGPEIVTKPAVASETKPVGRWRKKE